MKKQDFKFLMYKEKIYLTKLISMFIKTIAEY